MRRRLRAPLTIVVVSALAAVLGVGVPAPAVTRAATVLPIAMGELLPEGATSVDHIVLLYDVGLDATSVPATTDFSVTIDGATQTPTSVSIAYTTHDFLPTADLPSGLRLSAVRLGLSPSFSVGQTGSVTYTPAANRLRVGGVPVDGFSDQSLVLASWPFAFIAALTDEGQGPDHVIAGFSQP